MSDQHTERARRALDYPLIRESIACGVALAALIILAALAATFANGEPHVR